jgi:hypothetical protein
MNMFMAKSGGSVKMEDCKGPIYSEPSDGTSGLILRNETHNVDSLFVVSSKNTEGLKFDSEKPRMDLLDPLFLEAVAEVLTFGAKKYSAHNWRNGIHVSRLIAAAYRHLGAINRGEDIDPESGKPHTAHLGCCIQFLHWMLAKKPAFDDRWKGE